MKTLIFESEVLAEILKTDYCVPVVVLVDVTLNRKVQYSTPFGDSYGWDSNVKFYGVFREVEISKSNDEKYIDEIDCSEFLTNPDFKEEVDACIEKYSRGL